ncbi:MAG: branched-chain amino acid ABC transporter permease [Pseudomonadota bacterium]|nr:branched-chain amino acid ABC transporter permease [Pseudomonadota bacterium]
MDVIVFALLNGTIYGLLLFMMSSGLTLIFSMMGVLNFAHASFYMLGAYLAYTVAEASTFWAALFLAPVLVGLLGMAVERWGLRKVHANGHVAELLFTFGLVYVIDELVKIVWGRTAVNYRVPEELNFPLMTLFGADFPAYRAFILVVAAAMLGALWFILNRTRAGTVIRAALVEPDMVGCLGHNVPAIFMSVFGIGCALAGLAGVIGGNTFITDPAMAAQMGPIVFVVVVLGGLGSLAGAFMAAMLIGYLQTAAISIDWSMADIFAAAGVTEATEFGRISVASLSTAIPFLLLVLVLIARPSGLMGARES